MVHNRDLWGFVSIKNCPPNGYKPETEIVVEKVKDVKSFICVDDNPCKIVEIRTAFAAAKNQFIAVDIFTGKVYKTTFPLSGTCRVPFVTLSDYELVGISEEDSLVTVLDDKGYVKGALKLPTDQDLLSQIKFGFEEGKDVFVSVASAMGMEQIVASKILDPKLKLKQV
ncbi:eukaryotic translation initiation factor 5A-4-like [Apium graveolens]|uniref:eukaryotic translation initiation factor 5A-4-like n=1 Tax=Apium graveolens TaxID=4045 RepID=UPI003D7B4ABE